MSFSTLIPVTNQPVNSNTAKGWGNYLAGQESNLVHDKFSIGGLIFDYAGEVKAELVSDITDHWTENNSPIQDHIALHPIRVTMKGIIGELVSGPAAAGVGGLLQTVQSSLVSVPGYIGDKTPQAVYKLSKAVSQAQNVSNQISQAVSKGKSLYNFFKDGTASATRQAAIYKQLETFWNQRQLYNVNTPFRVYKNMAIESVICLQPESSKYLSEFTVTLKEIRQANIEITLISKSGDDLFNQKNCVLKNQGLNVGTKFDISTKWNPGPWKAE